MLNSFQSEGKPLGLAVHYFCCEMVKVTCLEDFFIIIPFSVRRYEIQYMHQWHKSGR
jgi:hypothetical protein